VTWCCAAGNFTFCVTEGLAIHSVRNFASEMAVSLPKILMAPSDNMESTGGNPRGGSPVNKKNKEDNFF
jgi:hypothetical protein